MVADATSTAPARQPDGIGKRCITEGENGDDERECARQLDHHAKQDGKRRQLPDAAPRPVAKPRDIACENSPVFVVALCNGAQD